MDNIVSAVRIVRLDNGRFHFFNEAWNGEDDIPYLQITPTVKVGDIDVEMGPASIYCRDINDQLIQFRHESLHLVDIRDVATGEPLQSVEVSKDSAIMTVLVAKLDTASDQALIPEAPPKREIDPEPSQDYLFKLYRDVDGEWCLNHCRVMLNVSGENDWYIEDLFGELRVLYLIDRIGDKVYRLKNLCTGTWSTVEMAELLQTPMGRSPLVTGEYTEVTEFELHVNHEIYPRIEYLPDSPARL